MTSDDWMSSWIQNYRHDSVLLKLQTTDYGTLEIHNDNPSGDPARDKFVSVTVRFK
jgi:hypothetical protein